MAGYFGKIMGGIIGGLLGGPWGAAIGVGLGHMVDSEEESSQPEVSNACNSAEIRTVEVKAGVFPEINRNTQVIWAHIDVYKFQPGDVWTAMWIFAEGKPLKALNEMFQDDDGHFVAIQQVASYVDSVSVEFDLVLPIEVIDLPADVRKLEIKISLLGREELDKRVLFLDLPESTREATNQRTQTVLNVLWGAVIADSHIDRTEVRTVKGFLVNEMGFTGPKLHAIKDYLRSLNLTVEQALNDARWVAAHFDMDVRTQLLSIVISIISADDKITKEEMEYVEEVARIFGIGENDVDRLFKENNTAVRLRALMILGLHSNATQDEISKRFKTLALKYHPDRLVNMDPEFQQLGAKKFRLIKDAYDTLMSNYK